MLGISLCSKKKKRERRDLWMVKQKFCFFKRRCFQRITESLKLEGTPSSSSSTTLLLKRCQLEQVTQHCVHPGCEYYPQIGTITSLGYFFQCLTTLTVKKCLLCLDRTSCVSICALLSCHRLLWRRDCLQPLHSLPSGIYTHW